MQRTSCDLHIQLINRLIRCIYHLVHSCSRKDFFFYCSSPSRWWVATSAGSSTIDEEPKVNWLFFQIEICWSRRKRKTNENDVGSTLLGLCQTSTRLRSSPLTTEDSSVSNIFFFDDRSFNPFVHIRFLDEFLFLHSLSFLSFLAFLLFSFTFFFVVLLVFFFFWLSVSRFLSLFLDIFTFILAYISQFSWKTTTFYS